MLHIQTFDQRQGGNVLYKALAHPLAAEEIVCLYARLAAAGPVVVYDPEGIAEALFSLYPKYPPIAALFVHDAALVGCLRAGQVARPVTELLESGAGAVLVAAFDAAKIYARLAHLLPPGALLASLDAARLPENMLSTPARYLDKLNFATNCVFFRDGGGLSTRLVSANYWANYGAARVRLWLRLYDGAGCVIAEWEQELPQGAGGYAIDSQEVRARFGLGEFTGQLMLHAIGVAGHDVVKYVLDTYATGNGTSLSCTHDANAWPSDRYAGLPAPRADERVVLWVQNSHASPIPTGTISLDRMGAGRPVAYPHAVPGFGTVTLDVAELLPGVQWPAQIELRCGRHMVRPRYEVLHKGRTRIAHVNVERSDLKPDAAIEALPAAMGRGFLLPFPVLDRTRFRTIVQPTPMAESQASLPLRVDVFAADGTKIAEQFLGCLPRDHATILDFDDLPGTGRGHAELVYDFRDGGSADGWMHALVRFEDRHSGHAAETSFGAHIFNTAMTWHDEPQSYNGPPPGLSTRLFLKLGDARRRGFTVLIYPASAPWRATSSTHLLLHDGAGAVVAEETLAIACSGSALVYPDALFGAVALRRAGPNGYVLVRDMTCRLFGYHGLEDPVGGFSLDHMFGF